MRSSVPRRSLRFKIIIWTFVPTAIFLFTAAVVTFYAYQQVTEDLVIQRDRELTRLSAGRSSTPGTSSIQMRPPPAPQHSAPARLRGISTTRAPSPRSSRRGSSYTPL